MVNKLHRKCFIGRTLARDERITGRTPDAIFNTPENASPCVHTVPRAMSHPQRDGSGDDGFSPGPCAERLQDN
jgi:hypothetical protein